MKSKWMNRTILAMSIQLVMGVAYAAEESTVGEYEQPEQQEQTVAADTAVGYSPQMNVSIL